MKSMTHQMSTEEVEQISFSLIKALIGSRPQAISIHLPWDDWDDWDDRIDRCIPMPHQTGGVVSVPPLSSNVRFDLLIFKLIPWSFGGWGTVGSYSICLFMDSGWLSPQ
jgi:hypothetical protein